MQTVLNRMGTNILFAACFAAACGLLASAGAGCGSTEGAADGVSDGGDGGGAANGGECVGTGASCGSSAECCSVSCDPGSRKCVEAVGGPGACTIAGGTCSAATDCCTMACAGGKCAAALCTSDNGACSANTQCCGGVCGTGDAGAKTCVPLNATCKTSGNTCANNGECCSTLCNNGVCNANPSYCTQLSDACASDGECCSGLCTKAAGAALGLCSVPAVSGVPDCSPAGQACTGATTGDGGAVPTCGGDCCSRSCRPFATTGVLICQPPSGCRPTGELCLSDKDCCGALGSPGSTKEEGGSGQSSDVHCAKALGATIGRCDNGKACSPAGSICRLAVTSCNATDRCCSGTVQQHPLNCKQDLLGIPRCTAASDYDCTKTGTPPAGTACASSADCCNNPCVPNPAGSPAFVCGAAACVPTSGACTTTADCCAGSPCNVATGATKGTCGPSGVGGTSGTADSGGGGGTGGTNCAQYGQVCAQSADCCNGVPCTNGRCGYVIK